MVSLSQDSVVTISFNPQGYGEYCIKPRGLLNGFIVNFLVNSFIRRPILW